ncbi:MAG: peptidoglycan-binding protein [Planctomycetota bacterium]|nr:peptidoglycan-binding protein [Planctomycetota bacterium]
MNAKLAVLFTLALAIVASAGCKTAARRAQEQKEKEMQDKLTNIEGQLTQINQQLAELRDSSKVSVPAATPEREPTLRDQMETITTSPVISSRPSSGKGASLAKKHIRVNASVKSVQLALKNAGFNPGPIDGICGERTIAAIRAFQAKEGLKQDGIVGSQTWAKLSAYLR